MRAAVPALIALLALAGCGGSSPARHARAPAPARAGRPTPHDPGHEGGLCGPAVDVLPASAHRGAPLRVKVIDVITALQRVAAHPPTPSLRAVGAGCAPPARGDGIGRAWRCEVSYATSPARSLAYRLVIRANGCWLATPATEGTRPPRTISPRHRRCGLTVRRPQPRTSSPTRPP